MINREGLNVFVEVREVINPKGLCFIMHGLGGRSSQKHIQAIAESFSEYNVVSFDTTHSFGKSEGSYEDATVTSYLHDLEDVISWSKEQPWYHEPFFLAGHSLGGICSILFSEANPTLVKGLIPVSPVISGRLSCETKEAELLEKWEKDGILETISHSGIHKRLKWSHMVDRMNYDVLPDTHKLSMPVLLVVGSDDDSTPERHVRLLYDALETKKELQVIQDAPHTFRDEKHLDEIKNVIQKWLF